MARRQNATLIYFSTNRADAIDEVITGIANLVNLANGFLPCDEAVLGRIRRRLRDLGYLRRCDACHLSWVTEDEYCIDCGKPKGAMRVVGFARPERLTVPDPEPPLPKWYGEAEHNLAELIRTGVYYLRTCRECKLLFVAQDKRQWTCHGKTCQRAADNARRRSARGGVRAMKRARENARLTAEVDRICAADQHRQRYERRIK